MSGVRGDKGGQPSRITPRVSQRVSNPRRPPAAGDWPGKPNCEAPMAPLFLLGPTARVIHSVELVDRPDRACLVAPAIASYWHAGYRRNGARGRLVPAADCLDGAAFRRSFRGFP